MKKIYFYFIFLFCISLNANDTISVFATKKINLREKPTTDSKVISKVNSHDTLKIIETEDGWSQAIFKDSLYGYVKSDYLKKIKQTDIKRILFKKILKNGFFLALAFISLICFGSLYFLKNKWIQLDILGNFSLIAKSILLGFVLTTIGTLYYFHELFSILKIITIILLLLILCFRIFSILRIEKDIKIDKTIISRISNVNIRDITTEIINKQIFLENIKLDETNVKLDNAIKQTNQLKEQQFSVIKGKLIELYGTENTDNLINNKKPFTGLNKSFIEYFIGKPEKTSESSDANNKWEIYFYDKINNRGHDGTYRLKINIHNDLVTGFQLK
ncbi:SH3 domain-containing protein [Flavobacterium davisii]|uniref:SH3 domain-containing protein n=1 Tax=Flavobacterium davisii TaxID=2906077 RepID=A0ABW8PM59_9FLAO